MWNPFSKSHISGLCQELDADIQAWRERPLEQDYSYLIIDATYLHIRTRRQVACEGVLIVSGIAGSGHRDILSLDVAHTETEATYADLFKDLKKRGLKGVQLIISDAHERLAYKTLSNDTFRGSHTSIVKPIFTEISQASHRLNTNVRLPMHSKHVLKWFY